MTITYPSPIFGPVKSRRLGISLGINLMPGDGKWCSFDCLYCECGLNKEDYKSYLDLRKYGGVIHSGFGLGFERMIMYLTGISNIRDVLPFPRTVGTLEN